MAGSGHPGLADRAVFGTSSPPNADSAMKARPSIFACMTNALRLESVLNPTRQADVCCCSTSFQIRFLKLSSMKRLPTMTDITSTAIG